MAKLRGIVWLLGQVVGRGLCLSTPVLSQCNVKKQWIKIPDKMQLSLQTLPVMILHGNKDPIVPLNQAQSFYRLGQQLGLNVTIETIQNGRPLWSDERIQRISSSQKISP